jgi:hypothetical protein
MRSPSAARLSLLAVALLSVAVAFQSYSIAQGLRRQGADPYGVERAALRLAPVLPKVPADALLGYLTDLPPEHPAANPAFLAAQYALAPRQLLPLAGGERPQWAVGNFSQPADYAAAGARLGLLLEADLGNGVVLYRRAQP